HIEQHVVILQSDCCDTARADVFELVERGPLDRASGGQEHECALLVELRYGNQRSDLCTAFQGDELRDRAAAALRAAFRYVLHFERVRLAAVREEDEYVRRARDEDVFEEIVLVAIHSCHRATGREPPTMQCKRHTL